MVSQTNGVFHNFLKKPIGYLIKEEELHLTDEQVDGKIICSSEIILCIKNFFV